MTIQTLMRDTTKALEQFLAVLCLDPSEVAPSLSESGTDLFLDLVVTTSARDEDTLRAAGADVAFATLARVIGDQSGLATVSIQIA